MSAQSKNIVIGPATVSFGGTDIGAIKKGGVEIEFVMEHTEIGDNENITGIEAIYRRFTKAIVRFVTEEASLANIKTAIGGAGSISTGSNPATFSEEFTEGMYAGLALVITGAAPRTTAQAAQTRTITFASAVPTAKSVKMVLSGAAKTEIPMEFTVLKQSGSDVAFSDVNA